MCSEGVVADVRHHIAPRMHMAVDANRINADEDMAGMLAERRRWVSKARKGQCQRFPLGGRGFGRCPTGEGLLVR